jgi:hypothetical protein
MRAELNADTDMFDKLDCDIDAANRGQPGPESDDL